MFKLGKKVKNAFFKISNETYKKREYVLQKIVGNNEGSGIVEYVGIAAASLILIVVVILPSMKSLFGVDVFPGLTSTVNKIFNWSA